MELSDVNFTYDPVTGDFAICFPETTCDTPPTYGLQILPSNNGVFGTGVNGFSTTDPNPDCPNGIVLNIDCAEEFLIRFGYYASSDCGTSNQILSEEVTITNDCPPPCIDEPILVDCRTTNITQGDPFSTIQDDCAYTACEGDEFCITIAHPTDPIINGALTSAWSTGESGLTICVTEADVYSVTITHPDYCDPVVREFTLTYEDCDPEPHCCGFEMDPPLVRIAPWDPCLVRMRPGDRTYNGECIRHIFSWDLNGDGTTDHVGPFFASFFTDPGPHTVCVTMSSGECGITRCLIFSLPNCATPKEPTPGISREGALEDWNGDTKTNIEIFPNPIADFLNINYVEDPFNPTQLIQVIDLTGKVVGSIQPENSSSIQLDVSNLSHGIYFVQFRNKDGMVATKRFIKSQN